MTESTEHPPLRLLALDTSTHLMSVGVSSTYPATVPGEPPVSTLWLHDSEGGARASDELLPAVRHLLDQADLALSDLDAVVFGSGPGSFTGLRTAAAVVQGLAYGTRPARHPTGLPVLGIHTLMAVAETARHQLASSVTGDRAVRPLTVTAVLDARMDEVYAATYEFPDATQPQAKLQGGPWLLKPEQLHTELTHQARAGVLAGNAFEAYGSRLPNTDGKPLNAWPTAAALLRLAPGLLAQGLATPASEAQPVYVRNKVAQTTDERLLARTPDAPAGPPPGILQT